MHKRVSASTPRPDVNNCMRLVLVLRRTCTYSKRHLVSKVSTFPRTHIPAWSAWSGEKDDSGNAATSLNSEFTSVPQHFSGPSEMVRWESERGLKLVSGCNCTDNEPSKEMNTSSK